MSFDIIIEMNVNKMKRSIKAAVVGGGSFGEIHLSHYRSIPLVEIGGVYTLESSRAEELTSKYGGKTYTSIDELANDKSIDLVSIVTPEHVHMESFQALAEAKKAIYVEKPIATNLDEAREMLALSESLQVMSGHCLRFEPRYAQVLSKLEDLDVKHLYFKRMRNRGQKEIYGRVHPIYCVLSHDIDLCNAYAGVPFSKVMARESYFGNSKTPDRLDILIEYENGITATLEGGWTLPDGARCSENDLASIVTSTEVIELALPNQGMMVYSDRGLQLPNLTYDASIYGVDVGCLRNALEYMVCCISEERPVEISTIKNGFQCIELIDACLRSVSTNSWIERS